VEAAGLAHEEIDIVLRTGGSSRIPAFVRMLEDRFGPERLHEMDLFTSVASGLGIAAQDGRVLAELRGAGVVS
jgi:hypothetical chaperone protein